MRSLRTILSMVEKDLRRRARAPLSTLLLLAFPVIFAGLLALTFGGGDAVPKIRLLIEDQDGTLLSGLVVSAFGQEQAAAYFDTAKVAPGEDARARLEEEDRAAILVIPKGFSDALLAGEATSLSLVKNPSQSILPGIAVEVTTVLADGLSSASRVLAGPLAQLRPYLASTGGSGPADAAVAQISVAANQALAKAGPYVFPPIVTFESKTAAKEGQAAQPAGGSPMSSLFLLVLPGVAVFALFSLCDQTMRDLLVEGRQKTLRRQLAGPVSAGTVIAGKALGTAAVGAIAVAVLSLVGWVALPGGVSLPAFLLLALATILAATGFAAFLFAVAKGEKQGAALASVVSLLMAFAGGSFIPLQSLPGALRAVSPFSLIFWATSGMNEIVSAAGRIGDILPNLAVLAGAGTLLLAASSVLWRRRLLRGDLA